MENTNNGKRNAKKARVAPGKLYYRLTQGAAWIMSQYLFKKRYIRNELRHAKGPAIVLCNHEAALDFVNVIGAANQPTNFVISNSFYRSLPFKRGMDRLKVIPKQQFQTSMHDISRMREVIDSDGILCIYPAGLMCEDGIGTPIPAATYRFIQWFNADIYIARSYGSYFVKPKWAKKVRRGRTYLDIYKLVDKETLHKLSADEFKDMAERALSFDAYREQDELRLKYKGCECIEGLENVLYLCPNCGSEFTIEAKARDTLCCTACSYSERSDRYGMLEKVSEVGEQIRYVSDWARKIRAHVKAELDSGTALPITLPATLHAINKKTSKFEEVGRATFTLTEDKITLD
ncbi:MAG: 1-acyl-sn-glycerol-3-phosphate acyltransferase, partial [Clostridia bacterium]|nr:1-acyl-sn-glycerol-3-phosphate acyltransferase [Clostridia bacterium]